MTTMTMIYIGMAIAFLAACGTFYFLGYGEGLKQGRLDGYAEASGESRRGCAQ